MNAYYNHYVLGYDVRVSPNHLKELWDSSRQEKYLFNASTSIPLSVDLFVWPSVFDYGVGKLLDPLIRSSIMLSGVPIPDDIGPNPCLWSDLDNLVLREHINSLPDHWTIAVTWVDYEYIPGDHRAYIFKQSGSKLYNKIDWEFLGIDIANSSMISGLSNCGYTSEERNAFHKDWGNDLNEHNLFTDELLAHRFCAITNMRAPEEAPFYCLGIYRGI